MRSAPVLSLLFFACTADPPKDGPGGQDSAVEDGGTGSATDDTGGTGGGTGCGTGDDTGGGTGGGTGGDDGGGEVPCPDGPTPFADAVVSFSPGEFAGYGADGYPDVVLDCPRGGGNSGSLDVLSLGQEGVIVLEFTDIGLVDGEGPDLLVFENPFTGFYETGVVAVSQDGETWHEWPCDTDDADGLYPGCAGVGLVYANPADPDIDMTDPAQAGGDAFDLADLGIDRARFVRIRDSGANSYGGTSGGFDLDAVGVVNGESL